MDDVETVEDVMLPGFRFHPTDEELVEYYLKNKIQQKSLPVQLIIQLDIYKYEPWDLPSEYFSSFFYSFTLILSILVFDTTGCLDFVRASSIGRERVVFLLPKRP